MKKIIGTIISVLSGLLLMSPVIANEYESDCVCTGEIVSEHQGYSYDAIDFDDSSLMGESDLVIKMSHDLEEKILNGLKNMDTTITLGYDGYIIENATIVDGKLSQECTKQLSALYCSIIDEHPEFIYIDDKIFFTYQLFDGNAYHIIQIEPKYSMTKTEAESALRKFNDGCEEIAEYLEENGKTDLEKALLLHDYMCINYEYDSAPEPSQHNPYVLLTEGYGVCDAYSKLYRYILGLCDINVKYAKSEEMKHLWNVVEIDGKWYNVDVTWDDPAPNIPGFVSHDFFLIGDEDFQNPEIFKTEVKTEVKTEELDQTHHDYVTEDNIVCEETYKDAFWSFKATETADGFIMCDSPIVFDRENWYYTAFNFNNNRTSSIVARSKKDGSTRNVTEFDALWRPLGTLGYYEGNFSSLALINGVLLYNTPTEIRYVLTNGNHDTLVAEIRNTDSYYGNSEGYIYYFGASLDGKFYQKEPFYTHIEYDAKSNNGFLWHYFFGKDKNINHIEIDYYVAKAPSGTTRWERDVDVHISPDDIHTFEEKPFIKQTYLTPAINKKQCTKCDVTEEIEIAPPSWTEVEDAHNPTVEDVVDVIKGIIGIGTLSNTNSENTENLDVDNDGKTSIHDINYLFKVLRDQYESQKG